jgi:hypothetical protein
MRCERIETAVRTFVNTLTGALIVLAQFSVTAAQRQPVLSGHWVMISATTGDVRGQAPARAGGASAEHHTRSNTVSGAAFNCGRECTIVQRAGTLTVGGALLSSATTPASTVVLQIDGKAHAVDDSFNPGRHVVATAAWHGNRLEITSPTGSHAFTQTLSVESRQLVVVTSIDIAPEDTTTFRYVKK